MARPQNLISRYASHPLAAIRSYPDFDEQPLGWSSTEFFLIFSKGCRNRRSQNGTRRALCESSEIQQQRENPFNRSVVARIEIARCLIKNTGTSVGFEGNIRLKYFSPVFFIPLVSTMNFTRAFWTCITGGSEKQSRISRRCRKIHLSVTPFPFKLIGSFALIFFTRHCLICKVRRDNITDDDCFSLFDNNGMHISYCSSRRFDEAIHRAYALEFVNSPRKKIFRSAGFVNFISLCCLSTRSCNYNTRG